MSEYRFITAGLVTLLGRLIRLTGNICKMACYPFHALFAGKRFFIPAYSPAKIRRGKTSSVPGMIWQTNYSNCCSLPMYLNYLFNRLMSLDYDYRYVSTEEREEYLRTNAPPEVYEAYLRLTDGAAQADLWRVTVLYLEGGIYMDIDATLVLPLRIILKGIDNALFVRIKHNTELTNYFLATVPGNPQFKALMAGIVQNILSHDGTTSVYDTTGPHVLNRVLAGQALSSRPHRHVCIQGAFTNEHFQYLDKPRGKWTYQSPKDLIKQ